MSAAVLPDDTDGSPKEFFPAVSKIAFNPSADPSETLVFRHYNADEVVAGKTMAEWLRFSMCFWHTLRGKGSDPFGASTMRRSWDDESASLANAKRRLRAAFELMTKLGVRYWTFHDRDIAPEGKDLAETNANLDEIVTLAIELQKQTGIKCLWGTANLFTHPRYANGAATNPDAHVFAYAAAQVKKAMEVTQRLGGENFVFWGGREGYSTLLNTNARRELDHMAAFFRMAIAHKEELGFKGQLLIEPKPKEPTKHQYDYDAQTVIGFLKTYGLDQSMKLNLEPNHGTLAGHNYEHDVVMASQYGFLGSIDANTGDPSLGWDTDQFPMQLKDCAALVNVIVAQGGIAPGGLNFDAKVRRESTDDADLLIAHVGAMDCFALALRRVVAMRAAGTIERMVAARYASFDSGVGRAIETGQASFKQLEQHILQMSADQQEPKPVSGQQEKYEQIVNNFLYK